MLIDTGLLLWLNHGFREERFLISRNIKTKWSTYWNVSVYKNPDTKWLNETPGLHFERSCAKKSAS